MEECLVVKFRSFIEHIILICMHWSDTHQESLDDQGCIRIQRGKMPFAAQEKAQILNIDKKLDLDD